MRLSENRVKSIGESYFSPIKSTIIGGMHHFQTDWGASKKRYRMND